MMLPAIGLWQQGDTNLHGGSQGGALVGGNGPVNQVQVEVLGLEFLHALQAVLADLGVVGVP